MHFSPLTLLFALPPLPKIAGWGNLMAQAAQDGKGKGGAELAMLSEADLARLLDRGCIYADDRASGADACACVRVCACERCLCSACVRVYVSGVQTPERVSYLF